MRAECRPVRVYVHARVRWMPNHVLSHSLDQRNVVVAPTGVRQIIADLEPQHEKRWARLIVGPITLVACVVAASDASSWRSRHVASARTHGCGSSVGPST